LNPETIRENPFHPWLKMHLILGTTDSTDFHGYTAPSAPNEFVSETIRANPFHPWLKNERSHDSQGN